MQIIENNYGKEPDFKTSQVTCEKCESKLIAEESDLTIGKYGCYGWTCPCCGEWNSIDKGIDLTATSVIYPQHFTSYSSSKKLDDDRITDMVRDCVSRLDKDIDFMYSATGDTIVIVFKSDEDYNESTVIVAKNYEETFVQIPKEKF